jgi:hypothetical protein
MPIAGPDSHAYRKRDEVVESTPGRDPIDELIETLREDFRREALADAIERAAKRRRRRIIRIASLLALAVLLGIAAIFRGALHLPH